MNTLTIDDDATTDGKVPNKSVLQL